MAGKQKLKTPLDYVHFLAGWPAPETEPEVQQVPVPQPFWMPRPMEPHPSMMPWQDDPNPYGMSDPNQPFLPPPVASAPFDGGMF